MEHGWSSCNHGRASFASLIMFGALQLLGVFRISEEVERKGMDIQKHGEPAYPSGSYGDGWDGTTLGSYADGLGGIDSDNTEEEDLKEIGHDFD